MCCLTRTNIILYDTCQTLNSIFMSFYTFCFGPLIAKRFRNISKIGYIAEIQLFLIDRNPCNTERSLTSCNLANVGRVLSKHLLVSITGHGSGCAAGLLREPGVCSHPRQNSAQCALPAALLTKRGHLRGNPHSQMLACFWMFMHLHFTIIYNNHSFQRRLGNSVERSHFFKRIRVNEEWENQVDLTTL